MDKRQIQRGKDGRRMKANERKKWKSFTEKEKVFTPLVKETKTRGGGGLAEGEVKAQEKKRVKKGVKRSDK